MNCGAVKERERERVKEREQGENREYACCACIISWENTAQRNLVI